MLKTSDAASPRQQPEPRAEASSPSENVSNDTEGDICSEAAEMQEQARQSRDPNEGETDLLDDGPVQPMVDSRLQLQ